MKLTLHNIGLIQHAEVKLDGITVIVGNNSTGKSTIGRALYLYCNSLNGMAQYIQNDRQKAILQELNKRSESLDLICKRITNAKRKRKLDESQAQRKLTAASLSTCSSDDETKVREIINEYAKKHAALYNINLLAFQKEKGFLQWIFITSDNVIDILEKSDDDLGKRRISEKLEENFGGQITRIPHKGEINATHDFESYIEVENSSNEVNKIYFERNKKAGKDVCLSYLHNFAVDYTPVYIENPRVIDKLSYQFLWGKEDTLEALFTPSSGEYKKSEGLNDFDYLVQNLLSSLTSSQETLISALKVLGMNTDPTMSQLEQYSENVNILEKEIDEIIGGQLVKSDQKGSKFAQDNLERNIEIYNMSTGIKALSLLRLGIEKGCIESGGILILDEPEINLHPEWQIKYAKIIVKMQRLLNLKIIITTHSPYFMQAIEYSSKLDGTFNKYHCYLAEYFKGQSRISCVDQFPSLGYKKLVEAFAELEQMKQQCERIDEV